ncbi:MAG: TOMM precursor leader peptide-binding protein [Verrucomicrobiota bacterium]
MITVPKFSPYWQLIRCGEEVLIVAEHLDRRVDDNLIAAVLLQIDGVQSSNQIAATLAPKISADKTFYVLIQLGKEGIIIERDDKRLDASSSHPGFVEKHCDATEKEFLSRIITVEGETDSLVDQLKEFLATQTDEEREVFDKTLLYSTRDFISSQTQAAAADAWNRGVSFLPVKFYGREPMVGPLFIPGETGCFECLRYRLRLNQRLKFMVSLEFDVPFIAERASAAWRQVVDRIRSHQSSQSSAHTVLQWSEADEVWISHPVIDRPDCPICGDKDYWKDSPGVVTITGETLDYDAASFGHRVISAKETLKHFSKHDSPLTGTFAYYPGRYGVPEYFGHFGYLTVATPPAPRDEQNTGFSQSMAAGGKGATRENALASGFGEAVERFCIINDDARPLHRARPSELAPSSCISPGELLCFSDRQYRDRERLNRVDEHVNIPEPMPDDPIMDWWPSWSLTAGRAQWLPAAFIQRSPRLASQQWMSCSTNGMAAGNCLEEALIQGTCELIERDAFGLWWYHMHHSPLVDLATVDSPYIKRVEEGLCSDGYRLLAYYLSIDTCLPVFAAVALPDNDDDLPMFGLGCHFQPRIALDRAVAELGQFWAFAIDNRSRGSELKATIINQTGKPLAHSSFLRPEEARDVVAWNEVPGFEFPSLNEEVEFLRDLFLSLDLKWLVADMSRPDLPLNVTKSVVPGFCHIHPQLSTERLYTAPLKLGWQKERTDETDLNPMPFFF